MNARLKEMPPNRPKVNQVQRKYLQDRLRDAQREKEIVDGRPVPPAVAAARKAQEAASKIVSQFDNGKWAREKRGRKIIGRAADRAREKILFGTPDEALAAVEAFERIEFVLK